MRYPDLTAKRNTQSMIEEFHGYNHTDRADEAEFFDMRNMTGDRFPLLSTRAPRGVLPALPEGAVGHVVKDGKLLSVVESSETLKLTVKEAVEAATEPSTPEDVTVAAYDPVVTVECADSGMTDWHGTATSDRIFALDPSDHSSKTFIGYAYSVDELGDNKYKLHFDGQNIEVNAGQKLYMSGKCHEKLIDPGEIEDGYMHLYLHGVSSAISGAIVLYPEWTFTTSGGGTFTVTSMHNGYAAVTLVDVGAGENGKRHVKVSVQAFFNAIDNPPTNAEIGSIVSFAKRTETQTVYHSNIPLQETVEIQSYAYTPAVIVQSSARFSYTEHQNAQEEANAAYQTAYEAYLASMYTAVPVRETVPETVAKALRDTDIRIGTTLCHVRDVQNNTLYIRKPNDAIAEGTAVDTQAEFLSLSETDLASGRTTAAPVGLLQCEGERQIVPMGAQVVIFPDKIAVQPNEKDANGAYTVCEMLETRCELRGRETASQSVLVLLCDAEYTPVTAVNKSATAPIATVDGTYWLDTSKTDVKLKVFSASNNLWSTVDTYLKIYSVDIEGFEAGDCVQMLDANGNAWRPENAIFDEDGGSHILYAVGKEAPPASLQSTYGVLERNYIVIKGMLKNGAVLAPATAGEVCVSMRRTVPDMEYVVESGNRLWGCHYGENTDGKTVNELYACKLGDPKNWHTYEGTALDSYAASLGTDGAFTGAAVYAGNPIFFKENHMHRVYGNYPANYQILTQQVHGVQKGSAKSLSVVNERLFFWSAAGVCVYDGSVPYVLSDALGDVPYMRGVGGACGQKYYISLQNTDGTRTMFTYDLRRGFWHKEDGLSVRQMLRAGEALLAVTNDRQLYDLSGTYGEAESAFEWYAESGNIGYAVANKKTVGRMLLRLDVSPGAYARVQIAYDRDKAYTDIYTTGESGIGSVLVPVKPHRCDHFRLRICGKGQVKLLSVCKTIYGGSAR